MSLRIAMWSGPRNISTAMMRAWENRGDTAVWDEPLYAHYLAETGLDHPGREAIIAAGERAWRKVAARCSSGPIPAGKAIFYQKHMTHHLLAHIGRDWLDALTHGFLIRDPTEVLLSYTKTRAEVTLEDIGLPQQLAIFEHVYQHTGHRPIVIDAADFLQNPRAYLILLCERWGVDYHERMLHWPPGPRASDGVWAPYWYESVWKSTGFAPYRPRTEPLAEHLKPLAQQALPYYETLSEHRLRV
jgi:hypothetical protein